MSTALFITDGRNANINIWKAIYSAAVDTGLAVGMTAILANLIAKVIM